MLVIIEQQGSRVMIAGRCEGALDLIYHYKPDLVKLDIMLAEIDGCPVYAKILHSESIFNFTSFPSTHQYIASSPITHYHLVAEKYIAYCYTK